MIASKQTVLHCFQVLEENNIRYALLRNINHELPEHYELGKKDIDIIVHPEDQNRFHAVMKNEKWMKKRHPWDFGNNFVFLYAMNPFEFYEKDGVIFDVCFQLCCRSINAGEWMPIDQIINHSVWDNRKKNNLWGWFELSEEDELIHLLTRCVFDKKEFKEGYIQRIEELLSLVDLDNVVRKAETVFFLFTDKLFDMIKKKNYQQIVEAYNTFIDY